MASPPEPDGAQTPHRPRWRRWLIGCGVLLLLLPLGGWLLRDLPRHLLVGVLERTLKAEVRLDALRIEALDRWRLEGLEVRRPGVLPPVARFEVETLRIEAAPRQLLARHLRRLSLEGADLRLEPGTLPETSGPSPLRYDALDPGRLRVVVASAEGGDETFLYVTGSLHDQGHGPRGSLAFEGQALELGPLAALATALGTPPGTTDPTSGDAVAEGPTDEVDTPIRGSATAIRGELELADRGVALTIEGQTLELVAPDLGRVGLLEPRAELRQASGGIELVASATLIEGRTFPTSSSTTSHPGAPTGDDIATHAEPLEARLEAARLELALSPELRPRRLTFAATDLGLRRGEEQLIEADSPSLEMLPVARADATTGAPIDRLEGSLGSPRVVLSTPSALSAERPGAPGSEAPRAPLPAIETVRVGFVLDLDDQGQRLEIQPQLPGLEHGQVVIERSSPIPGSTLLDSLATIAAEWRGLQLERWAPLLDPRLAELAGRSRGSVLIDGSSLVLEVELEEVSGRLATAEGPIEPPPALFPMRLSLESGRPGTSPSLAGRGGIVSPLGELSFGGRLVIADTTQLSLGWRWEAPRLEVLLPRLAAAGLTLPTEAEGLRGTLRASGRLDGPLDRPRLEARLGLAAIEGSMPGPEGLILAAGGGQITVTRESGGNLRIESSELGGELRVPGLSPLPFTLAAAGGLTTGEGTTDEVSLDRASLELPGARLEARGSAPLDTAIDPATWRGELSLEGLDLPTWLATLETPPPLLEGYDIQGSGRLSLTLEPSADGGGTRLHGPLELEGLGFASHDGARVLEGLGADLELELLPTFDGGRPMALRASAKGRGRGFLLLIGTLFADFSTFEPGLELELSWPGGEAPAELAGQLQPLPEAAPGNRIVWALATAEGGPAGGGPAEGNHDDDREGTPGAGEGALPWRLDLELDDLAALHAELLLPALGAEKVGDALEGSLHGSLTGTFSDAEHWTLKGEVGARALGAALAGWQLQGLDTRLPLDLRRRGAEVDGPRQLGTLSFAAIHGTELSLPGVETGLWIEGDALGLEESIEVPLYQGTVVIESLGFDQLLGEEPSMVAGLRLDGLQLADISATHDLLPLEGRLDGHLPRLRMAGTKLVVDGGGEVRLFGGVVRVHGITGSEVLSPFPRLRFSGDLEGIDLGALTRKIDFGEMTGVLQGTVRDCELFRGIPVACQAHFETVRRRGTRRTVDVKAVNNLTILGTGQGNLFDRGLRRFFKRFTYDQLVLGIDLANDALLLRGQPARGGREVFLSGRLPFPIQVVNAQPGRTVSFQAMRRRIESLDFDLATTQP